MKKNTILAILVILVHSFLTGCLSAQFAPANQNEEYSQRTPADKITIYRTQLPDKKFMEIGTINATGTDNTNELVEQLRIKAAENGGDAIISLEPYPHGMTATVIRFLDN